MMLGMMACLNMHWSEVGSNIVIVRKVLKRDFSP